AGIEYLLGADVDPAGEMHTAGWSSAEADAEARFELKGLLPRDYTLKLFDPARLELGVAGPFAAGARDAVVVFPRGAARPLRGRAVTRRGEPLAGVHLFLKGRCQGGSWIQGASADTD